ncbi:MAG: amidohydrolase [Tissierella sp.]|nr:amidohydrolase [Tissierella sp.]
MPETGVDPIYIGAQIVIGLQELITREISFNKGAVLTIGNFEIGSAPNIIPNTATIQGTMRTYDDDIQEHLKKRLPEIAKGIAEAYRGAAVTASEDFALVAKKVPGCMITLGAADPEADTLFPLHNPKVTFDEDAMPLGSAIFVECVTRWLEDNY